MTAIYGFHNPERSKLPWSRVIIALKIMNVCEQFFNCQTLDKQFREIRTARAISIIISFLVFRSNLILSKDATN